ncbi:hypothetical protein [Mycetocola spongiae]|uniref:hypothetical protein n=1 Tax=Mycetocola spongiae TaxID=2859226 RepID=UPI001CF170B9|nr:hypothetical protein [Mycetocola spongiae]UCR89325.1 hypothetical protein KXZ72_01030 [Mycetocola spongiae]
MSKTELIQHASEAGQDIRPQLRGESPRDFEAYLEPKSELKTRAANPAYVPVKAWWDNKSSRVAIRQGNASWGWTHVGKHNVSMAMMEKATRFPQSRVRQGVDTLVYRTPANEYRCWLAVCKIYQSMTVVVVVNTQPLSDGLPKGVITTYCAGPTVCAAWVRKAAG